MKTMKELDLHGLKHYDVTDVVENFVLMTDAPFRIITGKSDRMKELVETLLKKHHFQFYTPAHNSGEIIVID
jgi:hypothetical protein